MSFVLKKPKEFLLSHGDEEVPFFSRMIFMLLARRRIFGTPLAYLTGHKEFYGYDFKVNPSVLIPRPETEMMVDEVIDNIKDNEVDAILDIGTGSGCIIVSLAKELHKKALGKNIVFKAIDVSKKALETARSNAKLQNVDYIDFLKGDLLEPILKSNGGFKSLIITANLPYLTPKQALGSPSIKKEPRMALVAGNDGLKYYRKLFEQIISLEYDALTVYCEIDDSQSESIIDLIKLCLPNFSFQLKKDLRDLNRMLIIKANC